MTNTLELKLLLSGLSQVKAGLDGLGSQAKTAMAGISGAAAKVGLVLGGMFSAWKVAEGIKDIAALGGQLQDLSAYTGTSVKSLVVLRQAFQDAGLGADSVGHSLMLMQREIANAAQNGGAAAVGIERLGLSAQKLMDLAPDEQFRLLGERIAALRDPAARTAAAMDIFGRSGGQLVALFKDSGAFEAARKRLGALPEVLARNAETLDAISDSIESLPNKSRQLFAGIMDQLGGLIRKILEDVDAIDLTGVGQSIGAAVNMAMDAWKAGQFPELIGLTIEAGFELGSEAARATWGKLMDWIAGASWEKFSNSFTLVFLSLGSSLWKLFTDVFVEIAALQGAFMLKVASDMRAAFQGLLNWLRQELADLLNTGPLLRLAGLKATAKSEPVTPALSWAQAYSQVASDTAAAGANIRKSFDDGLDAAREMMSVGTAIRGQDDDRLAAWHTLLGRIDEYKRKVTSVGAEEARARGTSPAAAFNLAEAERKAKERLFVIEQQLARVAGDWRMTEAEKYQQKLKLMAEERAALTDIINLLQSRAAIEKDFKTREQILTRSDAFEKQRAGLETKAMGMGPDPHSESQNLFAELVKLRNEFGTTAQQIAKGFRTVIQSAVDGVATSMKGLLKGTMSWADALRNIGTTLMDGITDAIAKMFAEWITKRALAGMASILWSTKEGAADAAAKAPGALMTSISSWGIAAIVGVAAFVAAMALGGGFEQGGFTGAGPRNEPAGLVHRGEFVMPASTVNRVGVPALQAIREGNGTHGTHGNNGNNGTQAVNVVMVDSRREAAEYAASSEFESRIVQIVRKHRVTVGLKA